MKPRGGKEIIFGPEADQEPEEKFTHVKSPTQTYNKNVEVPILEMIKEKPEDSPQKQ